MYVSHVESNASWRTSRESPLPFTQVILLEALINLSTQVIQVQRCVHGIGGATPDRLCK